MSTARHPVLRRALQLAQLAAAVAGAVASFDFGVQIGGMPMGALLAANGAFFGAIMIGFVADLIGRERVSPSSRSGPGSSG